VILKIFKKKLIILVISFFISFLLCEFLLRFFFPQNINGFYQEQDNKSALWVLKSKFKYIDYFNLKPYIYTTGQYRNRITNENSRQNKKILALGDSFTFGEKLNDKDTFIHKLQNAFPNYYFINSAVPGWGLSNYAKFVENYCIEYKPNKILIFFNTDDIGRVTSSNQYFLKDKKLIKGSDEVYNAWYVKYQKNSLINYFLNNSHLFYFTLKTILNFSRIKNYNSNEKIILYPSRQLESIEKVNETIFLSKLIFLELKKNAENCKAELFIIYSGWINYKEINQAYDPTIKFLFEADNFFKKNNIKYFNNVNIPIMKDVHNNIQTYILHNDHHPNKLGADKIYQVTKNNLEKYLK